MQKPINIHSELAKLHDYWQPAVMTQGQFALRFVKFQGEFEWHTHSESDKVALVVQGVMGVAFDNGETVEVGAGELFVIPKNTKHKPYANQECQIVLIELATRATTTP